METPSQDCTWTEGVPGASSHHGGLLWGTLWLWDGCAQGNIIPGVVLFWG